MSDHCVHSDRTYYLLHFNYRTASISVTFEMGPSIIELAPPPPAPPKVPKAGFPTFPPVGNALIEPFLIA